MLLGCTQLGTVPLAGDILLAADNMLSFQEVTLVAEEMVKELEVLTQEVCIVSETMYKERELLFTEDVIVNEFVQGVLNGGNMVWIPLAKTSTTWSPLPRN